METDFWAKLREILLPGHLVRVENMLGSGTPDLSWAFDSTEGWTELKFLFELPKRDTTVVRIEHYTPQQKAWLYQRYLNGGNVSVLLYVTETKCMYLFRYPAFMRLGDSIKKEELIIYKINPNELKGALVHGTTE